MARARPGLQKAVNEILDRHGLNGKRLSFRQAERLTGLSPATISELAKGNARTPETLCRFAQGLGEEVGRLLLLAGFADSAEQLTAAIEPQNKPLARSATSDHEVSALLSRYDRALNAFPPGRARALVLTRLRADVELLESLGTAAQQLSPPSTESDSESNMELGEL